MTIMTETVSMIDSEIIPTLLYSEDDRFELQNNCRLSLLLFSSVFPGEFRSNGYGGSFFPAVKTAGA
jgi:hypothetical protein